MQGLARVFDGECPSFQDHSLALAALLSPSLIHPCFIFWRDASPCMRFLTASDGGPSADGPSPAVSRRTRHLKGRVVAPRAHANPGRIQTGKWGTGKHPSSCPAFSCPHQVLVRFLGRDGEPRALIFRHVCIERQSTTAPFMAGRIRNHLVARHHCRTTSTSSADLGGVTTMNQHSWFSRVPPMIHKPFLEDRRDFCASTPF